MATLEDAVRDAVREFAGVHSGPGEVKILVFGVRHEQENADDEIEPEFLRRAISRARVLAEHAPRFIATAHGIAKRAVMTHEAMARELVAPGELQLTAFCNEAFGQNHTMSREQWRRETEKRKLRAKQAERHVMVTDWLDLPETCTLRKAFRAAFEPVLIYAAHAAHAKGLAAASVLLVSHSAKVDIAFAPEERIGEARILSELGGIAAYCFVFDMNKDKSRQADLLHYLTEPASEWMATY